MTETIATATILATLAATPGVERIDHSINVDVTGIGDISEMVIDVKDQCRLTIEHDPVMVLLPEHVVVGGLVQDEDADNPLGEEAEILHAGRRGTDESRKRIYALLGLDSYGNPELSNDDVSAGLALVLVERLRSDRSTMAYLSAARRNYGESGKWDDVLKFVSDTVIRCGWDYCMDVLASNLFHGEYSWYSLSSEQKDRLALFSDVLDDVEAEKIWAKQVELGKIGDHYAVALDIYEHGLVNYTVSGEGYSCRFDTSRGGAYYVPSEDRRNAIFEKACEHLFNVKINTTYQDNSVQYQVIAEGQKPLTFTRFDELMKHFNTLATTTAKELELVAAIRLKAQEEARSQVESYTDWCNGSCYGAVVYVIDRKTGERIDSGDNEVWGFVGSRYANLNLMENVSNKVAQLLAN